MYNITIETASRHIKKLERIGLIKCIYDHNDKNTRRVIQLVDNIWDKWSIRDKSNNQEDIEFQMLSSIQQEQLHKSHPLVV